MDFFGIGPLEVLLILLIGFLVFGPRRLMEMSRNAGKAMRELTRNTQDFSARLQNELDEKAAEKPAQDQKDKTADVS